MMILVSYDVSTKTPAGVHRLRKIAETCVDFGLRVQNSVFECNVDPVQWEVLKDRLLSIYNSDEDSLRFYFLGSNWRRRVEHHGKVGLTDLEDPMIL
ncbi:MAG: CRISPR-associated endoribonuclease Cas2 [Bacteroidia bacterium]|nr:MAG: CRISPR-associated endoribonuclease Cas2 [Bacteroidia bacterium]